jgi:hypothetical protein
VQGNEELVGGLKIWSWIVVSYILVSFFLSNTAIHQTTHSHSAVYN